MPSSVAKAMADEKVKSYRFRLDFLAFGNWQLEVGHWKFFAPDGESIFWVVLFFSSTFEIRCSIFCGSLFTTPHSQLPTPYFTYGLSDLDLPQVMDEGSSRKNWNVWAASFIAF